MAMIETREQLAVALNIRGQLADPISNADVKIGALGLSGDLGSLLWRLKYAEQVNRGLLHKATLLLSNSIRSSRKFKRGRFTGLDPNARRNRIAGRPFDVKSADIIERFAQRLLLEWVNDACAKCNGVGSDVGANFTATIWKPCEACAPSRVVPKDDEAAKAWRANAPMRWKAGLVEDWVYVPEGESTRSGDRLRRILRQASCSACMGKGIVETRIKRRSPGACSRCQGSKREPISEAMRATALGVTGDIYRKHWHALFAGMLEVLDRVDGKTGDSVRARMRR
jgi:hypothetical protein